MNTLSRRISSPKVSSRKVSSRKVSSKKVSSRKVSLPKSKSPVINHYLNNLEMLYYYNDLFKSHPEYLNNIYPYKIQPISDEKLYQVYKKGLQHYFKKPIRNFKNEFNQLKNKKYKLSGYISILKNI